MLTVKKTIGRTAAAGIENPTHGIAAKSESHHAMCSAVCMGHVALMSDDPSCIENAVPCMVTESPLVAATASAILHERKMIFDNEFTIKEGFLWLSRD